MTDKGAVALWVVLGFVWTIFVVGITTILVEPRSNVITFEVKPQGWVCPQEDDPGWDWRVCGNRVRG